MDVTIGIMISKITKFNKNSENMNQIEKCDTKDYSSFYFELFYFFNPISLINCVQMKLDICFTFINLAFVINRNNLLGLLFLIISIILSPGFLLLNLFMISYFFITNEYNKKIMFILKIVLIFFSIVFLNFITESLIKDQFIKLEEIVDKFCSFTIRFIGEIKLFYYNYYFVKDTLPNIGMFWSLFPEVKNNLNFFRHF